MSDVEVRLEHDHRRYEAWAGAARAGYLRYRDEGDVRDLVDTQVDPAFQGRGVAAALVRAALDDIRAEGRSARASCSYVKAYVERHPDDADVVVD